MSAALMALWAGTAGSELYMQRTSLVLMLVGIVVYLWGFKLLRLMIVPLFLLLLAIPIPTIVFNKIAFPLQLFASRCAVWAMSVFDIPVLRQGNVIELMPLGARETKKLEVVEACSGIRSLMTLVTLAVVFAYFTHPRNDSGRWRSARNFGHLQDQVCVGATEEIWILALYDHRAIGSSHSDLYKRPPSQRHGHSRALLRNPSRRRLFSQFFWLGHLRGGISNVVWSWLAT